MRGKESWIGNELGKIDIINMNTVNARVGLIEGSIVKQVEKFQILAPTICRGMVWKGCRRYILGNGRDM